MLLKSSSTPVLGSLIPSFSDSPNNNNHTQNPIHGKISRTNNNNNNQFRKPMFHSPSLSETKTSAGFRRVQSEGNLEELANATYNIDEFSLSKNKPSKRSSFCTLDTIPSFSLRHLETRLEDDDSDEELEDIISHNPTRIENLVSERVRSNNNVSDYGGLRFGDAGKMYLATGLGVSNISYDGGGGGGGGGGGYRPVDFDWDGGDVSMEDYYKRMLEENPGDALFLRNYAQFLYQKKRDLNRAEEYYSRAILADPKDGEILSQYAKLIWELHRDKERAANYFVRAVQASSEDSHIHAAYASFLWDTEEENDAAADNFPWNQRLCAFVDVVVVLPQRVTVLVDDEETDDEATAGTEIVASQDGERSRSHEVTQVVEHTIEPPPDRFYGDTSGAHAAVPPYFTAFLSEFREFRDNVYDRLTSMEYDIESGRADARLGLEQAREALKFNLCNVKVMKLLSLIKISWSQYQEKREV
ncbi:hypothetical protein PHJA_000439500 [Phtheirospermum japonicum]|uniref:Uncharacterized protein n=1 Tax=Phtheirospermum japonicum TaxID=374723 RepID=A0A830BDU1_9LAMI|nr:hypothetical protein PHJA_000439500 [Phtheirospermum japonicum]